MIRTKIIGRLPQNYGNYDPSKPYGKKQRCFLYGCEWESKMEGNTYAPATLNTTTGVVTPDTAHWIHCSGSYNDWLIDNGYKKVDAGNVKDGNSTQHEINAALAQGIADETQRAQNAENDRYTKSEVYTKAEVNSLITTPDQGFVSVTATSSTTSATDVLPATGEPDTIYRVGNWDGSQYDASCYTEYAWSSENTSYIKLSTKQVGIDDTPTAGSENLVKSGGVQKELALVAGKTENIFTYQPTGQYDYITDMTNYSFVNGHRYFIHIEYAEGETSNTYFSIRSSDGSVLQNGIGGGTSTRDVEFTCNVSGGEKWALTLVPLHSDIKTFACYIVDLNELSLYTLEKRFPIKSADVDNSITQSLKCISVPSERNLTYESGSNNIYITAFHYYTRGGVDLSLNNITDLKNKVGGSFTPAPSGVDSVLVPDRYKLVLRGTSMSIVSYEDIDISEKLLLAVINGIIVDGEFATIETKDIANSAITEEKIADKSVIGTKISQDLYKETIGLFTNVFVAPATSGTYVTYFYNVPFINGHRYRLTIKNPVGYSGETYFSVRGYNGSTSIYQNDLLRGIGDREGEFICNIDGGLSWCLTVVEGHESELQFECTMLDLDIDSVGNNSRIIKNILGETDIIQLNNKVWLDNIFSQSARAARFESGGTAQVAESQLVFLHFSDLHGDITNLKRIISLSEHYAPYINDVICSGDMVTDKWEDGYSWWDEAGAGKILVGIGNHDVQTSGTAITSKQAYDRYIEPFVSQWGVTQPSGASENGYNYYYKDYPSAKMRLLCLDCMFWDSVQANWLTNVLTDARTLGYAVICTQHYPFGQQESEDTPFNSLMPRVMPMTNTQAVSIVQDFIDGSGEFVCWLVGHEHSDYFGTIQEYPEQLVITIANAGLNAYWDDTARVKGEKSQDCFNIISFDYHQKMIKIARVGADYDRLLRHKGTLCYKYDTRHLVTT